LPDWCFCHINNAGIWLPAEFRMGVHVACRETGNLSKNGVEPLSALLVSR